MINIEEITLDYKKIISMLQHLRELKGHHRYNSDEYIKLEKKHIEGIRNNTLDTDTREELNMYARHADIAFGEYLAYSSAVKSILNCTTEDLDEIIANLPDHYGTIQEKVRLGRVNSLLSKHN